MIYLALKLIRRSDRGRGGPRMVNRAAAAVRRWVRLVSQLQRALHQRLVASFAGAFLAFWRESALRQVRGDVGITTRVRGAGGVLQ